MTRKVLIGAVAAVVVASGVFAAGGAGILFQAMFRASGTGAVDRAAMLKLRDVVSVKDFGATGDGTTDDTAAIQAAVTACPSTGCVINFSEGTFLMNLTLTRSHVTLRGKGRRATLLKPATASPVITIDSSGGSVISNTIEDLGFTASSSAASAITITGTNVNDWHKVQRAWISGFTKGINIPGRCTWCAFRDIEVTSDASNCIDVTSSASFNSVLFDHVAATGCTAGNGFEFNQNGGNSFKGITLLNCNAQSTLIGVHSTNVDSLSIVGGYFESNTTADIKLEGTFAQGFLISANQAWSTSRNIWIIPTLASGAVIGNRLNASSTAAITSTSSHADASVLVSGNLGNGPYSISGGKTLVLDGKGWLNSRFAPTYGVTVTIDMARGAEQVITATNGVGFTISNPTNTLSAAGQRLAIRVRNTSGGALGAITWDTQYKMAAWTSPATANSRYTEFVYDGTNWIQTYVSAADVPN